VWVAYLQLSVTMVLWGVAWPVGRLLVQELPPFSISAVRYALVVPAFFLILRLREHRVSIPRSWMPTFVFLGLVSTTFYQILFLLGVQFAAASDSSMVIGIHPVLVAVLAAFLVGERLTWPKITGLACGLVGILIIAVLSPNTQVLNRPLGVVLVVAAAASYALYTVYLRKFITRRRAEPSGQRPSTLAIITWVTFFGWLFFLPPILLESPWSYTWSTNSWIALLYLAFVSTILGTLFYAEGVSRIGAGRTAIFVNLVAVFGIASSFLLLHEAINSWHGVSFVLVFAGVYLVNTRLR
jgi:drug/metabolite transporter (DMT)-like permease